MPNGLDFMQSYIVRELTEEEFKPLYEDHKKSVFEDTHSYDFRDVLTDIELGTVVKLAF